MGSQVRILYRPPSKAQVRGVKPLTFFFLTPWLSPKVAPKSNRSRLRRHFYRTLFADAIARFALNACVFSLNSPCDPSANVETGTICPERLPAVFCHTTVFRQNSSSFWFASGTYPHDSPVDNRRCSQSARPAAETRGGPHGRDRLRKHCIPLLALPTASARPLSTPAQLRRRLASPSQSPFRNRRPQNPSHHSCINTKQPAFRDKTDHPME